MTITRPRHFSKLSQKEQESVRAQCLGDDMPAELHAELESTMLDSSFSLRSDGLWEDSSVAKLSPTECATHEPTESAAEQDILDTLDAHDTLDAVLDGTTLYSPDDAPSAVTINDVSTEDRRAIAAVLGSLAVKVVDGTMSVEAFQWAQAKVFASYGIVL